MLVTREVFYRIDIMLDRHSHKDIVTILWPHTADPL